MTRAEIKELLTLAHDAHKAYKHHVRELITIQQGLLAAVAALATALNDKSPDDSLDLSDERN